MITTVSISKELKRAQSLLDFAEDELSGAPPGTLKVHNNKGHIFYSVLQYQSDCGQEKELYLRQKESLKCSELAQKRYYKTVIPRLYKRIAFLRKAAKAPDIDHYRLSGFLPDGVAKLCSPLCFLPNRKPALWSEYDPERNPFHPERCIYETKNGDFVRSKSELMVANLLYESGLLYKYEAALSLKGKTIYPDFTILSPNNGALVFWEHCGMMDDHEYYNNFITRKRLYNDCQLFEGSDLVFTFESSLVPLTPKDVQLQIDRFWGA